MFRVCLLVVLTSVAGQITVEVDNSTDLHRLRLNEIQVIATHNSYHVQPEEPRFSEMIARNPRAASWGYTHAPLNEQLDSGVRGFELDVYYQPDGYFKVLHVPDFDYGTTCDTFVDCLGEIGRASCRERV